MKIRVRYTAQLRTALGRSEEDVELADKSTVAMLLSYLAAQHSHEARAHVVAPSGEVLKSLLIVVNDSAPSTSHALALVLKPGDVVDLLPPIAGG